MNTNERDAFAQLLEDLAGATPDARIGATDAVGQLLTADTALPPPDPAFVRGLRDRLVEPLPMRRADARSFGIVAAPPARPHRRLSVLAAAAVVALAVLAGGMNWDQLGRPSINVATAQATIQGWTPTPTATATQTPWTTS